MRRRGHASPGLTPCEGTASLHQGQGIAARAKPHPVDRAAGLGIVDRSAGPAARFARIIKRIFGITPSQLIAKTRIAAASRLLRETDRTIADIAHECGFTDHSAFTRAFRAVTGVTPTHFRNGDNEG